MKRIYYLLLILALSATGVNSQVRIGNANDPHQGAILDLKSDETIGKGVLFPPVYLNSLTLFSPVEGSASEGMIIYNTNGTIGKGIYVWDGKKWMKAGDASVPVTSVTISGEKSVRANTTIALSADVLPETASVKTILWTVSNASATINALNGRLTGVTPGTVSVYATALDGSGVTSAVHLVSVTPPGYNNPIENGVYEKNYTGDYLTSTQLSDGDTAPVIKQYFTATNNTLYVYDADSPAGNWHEAANTCYATNGGRVPNLYELALMHSQGSSLGDSFQQLYYWSSTERSETIAWGLHFNGGVASFTSKELGIRQVRCVRNY